MGDLPSNKYGPPPSWKAHHRLLYGESPRFIVSHCCIAIIVFFILSTDMHQRTGDEVSGPLALVILHWDWERANKVFGKCSVWLFKIFTTTRPLSKSVVGAYRRMQCLLRYIRRTVLVTIEWFLKMFYEIAIMLFVLSMLRLILVMFSLVRKLNLQLSIFPTETWKQLQFSTRIHANEPFVTTWEVRKNSSNTLNLTPKCKMISHVLCY